MHKGGVIVYITSVSGIKPSPGAALYGTAKAGLENLTKSLALEYIKNNIRMNSVAPGVTYTPRWQERLQDQPNPEELKKSIEAQIPLKRFGCPEEIASAVIWLLSGESSYVVGHTLVVDGGISLIL
ncbi:MAG: SDR family oxidoreductase [Chitinivibrionales bacterium]|nr:SDR family oxidoreductase [Chitinivibrionales bacterium]